MTRRAWWLLLLGVLIPGSAQVLAGRRRLGRFGLGCTLILWALAVLTVGLIIAAPAVAFTVVTTEIGLWAVQALLVFYAVVWLVLSLDTLRLLRLGRVGRRERAALALVLVVCMLVGSGGAAYGAYLAGIARSTISSVFSAEPAEPAIDGRYNVLLLGADSGPDRDGLRPDSVSVVSVEEATGKVDIIGLPRNLRNMPFSEGSPMLAQYPNGYGYNDTCDVDVCQLNSIYTEVTLKSPELYPDAVDQGSEPGIEAMRDAVEGSLGIQLQYYVVIDMQGFADLVDALGGIDVTVTEKVPVGGHLDGNGDLVDVGAWIRPGERHLDGNKALWYARSRYGSDRGDYARMERQREVQEAILNQVDPVNVLTKFQAVAAAGEQVVKTDIPQGTLGRFAELALKARQSSVDDLELVPDTIDPEAPDYGYIQELVAEALAPGEAASADG